MKEKVIIKFNMDINVHAHSVLESHILAGVEWSGPQELTCSFSSQSLDASIFSVYP